MQYHKSCDTLMMGPFTRMLDTGDVKILLFDPLRDVTKEETQQLHSAYKDIIYHYAEITNSVKTLANIKKRIMIAKLTFQYNTCVRALKLYVEHEIVEVLEVVIQYYHINFKENLDNQIEKIVQKLAQLKTRIDILKIKYDEQFNKKQKVVKIDLYKQAAHIEIAAPLSYGLDPETTTVSKWVALMNRANNK